VLTSGTSWPNSSSVYSPLKAVPGEKNQTRESRRAGIITATNSGAS